MRLASIIPAAAWASAVFLGLAGEGTLQPPGHSDRVERVQVPSTWQAVRVCAPATAHAAPQVVVGELGEAGTRFDKFALRPLIAGPLPDYLVSEGEPGVEQELYLRKTAWVGYTDTTRAAFVLPNGLRLSCQPLQGADALRALGLR